jgi:hypothetical protein
MKGVGRRRMGRANRDRTVTARVAVAAAVATLVGGVAVSGSPVWAQAGTNSTTAAANPAAEPRVPAMVLERVTLAEAVTRIAKASGARVVVDRTLLTAPVTFQTLGGPLPVVLKELTARLPAGALVKTTLLPAPGANALDGDAVAGLIAAEEAMLKAAAPARGATPPPVAIMGALVPAEKAPAVIEAMNLEAVYLLTNPNAILDPVQRSVMAQTDALRNWMGLTPEQKAAAMEQQLDALFNMDPAARRSLFSQQTELGMKFLQKVQSLPQDQQKQFWSDLTGGRWDGTMPPQPGGGAGGATP